MTKKKQHALLSRLPSSPSPTTVNEENEETRKTVSLLLPDTADFWWPANRFRVELTEGAVLLYLGYQDKYEAKIGDVLGLTIPFTAFRAHFVTERRESFARSVDKQRAASFRPVKILTEEELREVKILNSFVNFGGLAISSDAGGEAWFGVYSPWQTSQIPSINPKKSNPASQPSLTIHKVIRSVMLNSVFIQLWDELVNIADQIKV